MSADKYGGMGSSPWRPGFCHTAGILFRRVSGLLALLLLLAACSPASRESTPPPAGSSGMKVLAVESFLADLTRMVAGDRLVVDTLIANGTDPHAFEPTPQDVARIAGSRVIITNGAGLEGWLDALLANAGGEHTVIIASAGLQSRAPGLGEPVEASSSGKSGYAPEADPHFWLDPIYAIRYVENIHDGLAGIDPQGKDLYDQNAAQAAARLEDLDRWIQAQVDQIPPERRVLVTNHESFGYFADRYGFTIVGTVLPGTSTGVSPSARELAQLVKVIEEHKVPAIFLETGANPKLAGQIAGETGAKVVEGLYSEALSAPDGPAPDYFEMMRYNTRAIVEALK